MSRKRSRKLPVSLLIVAKRYWKLIFFSVDVRIDHERKFSISLSYHVGRSAVWKWFNFTDDGISNWSPIGNGISTGWWRIGFQRHICSNGQINGSRHDPRTSQRPSSICRTNGMSSTSSWSSHFDLINESCTFSFPNWMRWLIVTFKNLAMSRQPFAWFFGRTVCNEPKIWPCNIVTRPSPNWLSCRHRPTSNFYSP